MIVWVLTNEYEGNIIGGLGTVATHLSKALSNHNDVHVTVICHSKNTAITSKNLTPSLQIIRFPNTVKYYSPVSKTFNPLSIYRLLIARGYRRPDVIHIHSLQFLRLAQYCKKRLKIPVIYTCHSLVIMEKKHPRRLKSAVMQIKLMRLADAVTVPSQWLKRQINRYYPFFNNPIEVIPNGILIRKIIKKKKVNLYRILYVGRLISLKGIEQLIGAIYLLKKNKPKVMLAVVGEGSKAYMNKLKVKAKKLNVQNNIKWLGRMKPEKVQRLYSAFGSVVVPSKQESFGLVALEAMGSGVPLVTTRKGGLASFVDDSNATIILRVQPRVIAESIRSQWGNPAETEKRRMKARETAKLYGWTRISAIYYNLFVSIRNTKHLPSINKI